MRSLAREIPSTNGEGTPILELVDQRIRIAISGCWEWTAQIDSDGYGRISLFKQSFLAHRVSYTAHVADIPADLTLDHLCRNKSCVNPDHLEPVTNDVNLQRTRRTHCGKGHSLADAYLTRKTRAGGTIDRQCRECTKQSARDYRARKKLQEQADFISHV